MSPQQLNAIAPTVNSVEDLVAAMRGGCQLYQPAFSHHYRLLHAGKRIKFDEKHAIAAVSDRIVGAVGKSNADGSILFKLTTRAGGAQE